MSTDPVEALRAGSATGVAIDTLLSSVGDVFRVYDRQDSGCVSYGVRIDGRRLFVKHAAHPDGVAGLWRARQFHSTVRHRGIPTFHGAIERPEGVALVFDWVDGELVRVARDRFRAQPVPRVLAALDVIYDVHLEVARLGYVAVDFYDGCVIHDFDTGCTHLCDFDEYHPGPFVLDAERLPGSTRFMAPEEWHRGAWIDEVTNVFTLGRAALVLLSEDAAGAGWRGSPTLLEVARRAAHPDRARRYSSVTAFVTAWRGAGAAA